MWTYNDVFVKCLYCPFSTYWLIMIKSKLLWQERRAGMVSILLWWHYLIRRQINSITPIKYLGFSPNAHQHFLFNWKRCTNNEISTFSAKHLTIVIYSLEIESYYARQIIEFMNVMRRVPVSFWLWPFLHSSEH